MRKDNINKSKDQIELDELIEKIEQKVKCLDSELDQITKWGDADFTFSKTEFHKILKYLKKARETKIKTEIDGLGTKTEQN